MLITQITIVILVKIFAALVTILVIGVLAARSVVEQIQIWLVWAMAALNIAVLLAYLMLDLIQETAVVSFETAILQV